MKTPSILDRARYPITLEDGRIVYSRHEYRRLLEQQLEGLGTLRGEDARGLPFTANLEGPATSVQRDDAVRPTRRTRSGSSTV